MNGKRLTADQYTALYPARPKAIRKIAYALRKIAAEHADKRGVAMPFNMYQFEMAKRAGVSVRTLQRYLPLFEKYLVLEKKQWRHTNYDHVPNTYRIFIRTVIPQDYSF